MQIMTINWNFNVLYLTKNLVISPSEAMFRCPPLQQIQKIGTMLPIVKEIIIS